MTLRQANIIQIKYTKKHFIKGNKDTLDYILIKNDSSSEDIIKALNRQTTEWEKIFTKQIAQRVYMQYIPIEMNGKHQIMQQK